MPNSTSRGNALAARVTSLISSSYGDLQVKESLELLDARGVKNKPETRRNLRLDVQKEILNCNSEIIADFGQLALQLQKVGDAIKSLQDTCADLRKHVTTARIETAPMLDEASTLMTQKSQAERKKRLLNAFSAHFLLTDDELVILTSTAEPVHDQFFQILVKAKRIHKDCQVLLGTENQRLGMEILEQSTRNLNAAYQKLYRWVQREFKSLDLENLQVHTSIRRALRVLAERPTLFQSCLDTFAEARDHALSDAFYAALTGTAADRDTQKPIEFSAHEPLRYVGDMLAWTHSSTVSEREALEGLFISDGDEIAKSIQEGLEGDPWSRTSQSPATFDGKKALSQLANRSLAGVASLLRQRVDEVVNGHEEPILAYKIAVLCAFYSNIFTKLVDESGFLETLSNIQETALRRFTKTMRDHVATVQGDLGVVAPSLSIPAFFDDALKELKSLLKSYETSAQFTDKDGQALQLLLSEALDPFLNSCDKLSNTLSKPSDITFRINCLLATKDTLMEFQCAMQKVEKLDESIEDQLDSLRDSLHEALLRRSGMRQLEKAATTMPEDPDEDMLAKVAKSAMMSQENMLAASEQLDSFLASAQIDAAEYLKGLRSPRFVSQVTTDTLDRFVDAFEAVVNMLERLDQQVMAAQPDQTEDSGQAEPLLRDLYPRTLEQVKILLS